MKVCEFCAKAYISSLCRNLASNIFYFRLISLMRSFYLQLINDVCPKELVNSKVEPFYEYVHRYDPNERLSSNMFEAV